MQETLLPLKLPPGLYRNGTTYQAKGRWYDGTLIRFFEGSVRPIGGWVTQVDVNNNPLGVLPGMPRCMLTWRYTDGSPLLVIGTTTKLKLLAGGSYFDITPAGFTSGRIDSVYSGSGGSYGNLAYGAGAYGVGAASSTFLEADTWTLDNFGGFLCGIC